MKKIKTTIIGATACFSCFLLLQCKKKSDTDTGSTVAVPAVYSKIYGATSITNDGTYITIKSTGSPDHKSVYYPTANSLYEAFSGTTFGGTTFNKNPNSIAAQNYTFKNLFSKSSFFGIDRFGNFKG